MRQLVRQYDGCANQPLETHLGRLSPLMLAAACSQVAAGEILLQAGADAEAVASGKTAIDFAIFSGYTGSYAMVQVCAQECCGCQREPTAFLLFGALSVASRILHFSCLSLLKR